MILDPLLRGPLSFQLRTALLDRRPDDQFIAAFPRSGSTWLRTMLTDVLVPGADGNPDVFNARIPGIKLRRVADLRDLPSPRLLMTHSPWQPALRRAVYVVRDGRASVVSYYHYLTTRKGRELPFELFFERYMKGAYGVPWHVHVEGWLGAGAARMSENLHVVRFEDMKASRESVFEGVVRFLGIEADDAQIRHAAGRANLDNARRIEERRIQALQRGPLPSDDASFYRGGRPHGDDSPLAGALLARFEAASARALGLAGYR